MWLGDVTDTTSTDTTPADTSSSGGWFASALQDFAQFKLAQQQLNTTNQITALQLQRAKAGLPPLNIDPSTLGVPSLSVGLSPGVQQILQIGVFAALGLMAINTLARHRR